MQVTIDIPSEAEAALRAEWGDIDRAATEALLIESYRTGRISIGFLGRVLGGTRWDAEKWLADRGVHWNYGSEEFEADLRTLERGDA